MKSKYRAITILAWVLTIAGAIFIGAGIVVLISMASVSVDALTVLLTGGASFIPLAVGLFLFANGQVMFLVVNVAEDVHVMAYGRNAGSM